MFCRSTVALQVVITNLRFALAVITPRMKQELSAHTYTEGFMNRLLANLALVAAIRTQLANWR